MDNVDAVSTTECRNAENCNFGSSENYNQVKNSILNYQAIQTGNATYCDENPMCVESWVNNVIDYPTSYDSCDLEFAQGRSFVWNRCGLTSQGDCCVGTCSLPKGTNSCHQRTTPDAIIPLIVLMVISSIAIALWTELTRDEQFLQAEPVELTSVSHTNNGFNQRQAGGTIPVVVPRNKRIKSVSNVKHKPRRQRDVFHSPNK